MPLRHFFVPTLFVLAAIGIYLYNTSGRAEVLAFSWFSAFFPGDMPRQGQATVALLLAVAAILGVRSFFRLRRDEAEGEP